MILWGVHGNIWLIFLCGNAVIIIFLIWWYREKIRKKYYTLRFPEKLLKVIIHYPSSIYKEFWRVIPEENIFVLDGNSYEYIEKEVIKQNEFFMYKRDGKEYVKVGGKEYEFDNLAKIQKRKGAFPEIHYWFNCSKPIHYDFNTKKVDFSAKQLTDFKDNDLFAKLLNLEGEKQLIIICIILGILTLLCTVYIILKMHGVFDK